MKTPATKTSKNTSNFATVTSFDVPRAKFFPATDDRKECILFDLTVNDVTIYGCRAVQGKNGDFISFPQRKGSDGKYYSYAFVKLSEEDLKEILKKVEAVINE